MNEQHAHTARELHSQTKILKKKGNLDFDLTDRNEVALNRSVDNISQDYDLEEMNQRRMNATMPEGEFDQDDEFLDGNYFFGGSPNKAGL